MGVGDDPEMTQSPGWARGGANLTVNHSLCSERLDDL
jgi:hypothetical protein